MSVYNPEDGKVLSLCDKVFENYHDIHDRHLSSSDNSRKEWLENICSANYEKHLPGKTGKILEIGCSRGYVLNWLINNGYKDVFGVDLSPKHIEMAKEEFGLENVYCADVVDYLAEKKDFFSCVISKDVLEHIDKNRIDEFLGKVKDSLLPGGRVLIQVPNMDWIMAQHERYMDITHQVGFTRESLGELLRLYFEDVSVSPVVYDFPASFKGRISSEFLKPMAVKLFRLFLKILGEGAHGCWFEYREIFGIGVKKSD